MSNCELNTGEGPAIKTGAGVFLLADLFEVCAETSELRWKHRPLAWFRSELGFKMWTARYAGKPALTAISKGYRHGHIFARKHQAHRVVYAMLYGQWPLCVIDHIDGNRSNNSKENLRAVDWSENAKNRRKTSKNSSGVLGVSFKTSKQKWRASIGVDGKTKTIGDFHNFEDAVKARKGAEIKYGYHANHGGPRPGHPIPLRDWRILPA